MIALSKKAVKLKNDNYLDSTSVVHKKKLLSTILDKLLGIETITNENGTAIKFSDGTMICTKTISGTCTTVPWGAIFYYSIGWTDWPVIFKTIQSVHANSVSELYWCSASYDTYGAYTRLFRPTEATDPYSVCLTAIGRWK